MYSVYVFKPPSWMMMLKQLWFWWGLMFLSDDGTSQTHRWEFSLPGKWFSYNSSRLFWCLWKYYSLTVSKVMCYCHFTTKVKKQVYSENDWPASREPCILILKVNICLSTSLQLDQHGRSDSHTFSSSPELAMDFPQENIIELSLPSTQSHLWSAKRSCTYMSHINRTKILLYHFLPARVSIYSRCNWWAFQVRDVQYRRQWLEAAGVNE